MSEIIKIVCGNTIYSDNFKLDYLTGGWIVVDREKMIRELEDALKAEREKVLWELREDLQTRFISSSNRWSKGRNSGLIVCCNIIDESLRGEKE